MNLQRRRVTRRVGWICSKILHSPINSKNFPTAFAAPPRQILMSGRGAGGVLLLITSSTRLHNDWSFSHTHTDWNRHSCLKVNTSIKDTHKKAPAGKHGQHTSPLLCLGHLTDILMVTFQKGHSTSWLKYRCVFFNLLRASDIIHTHTQSKFRGLVLCTPPSQAEEIRKERISMRFAPWDKCAFLSRMSLHNCTPTWYLMQSVCVCLQEKPVSWHQ